MKRKLPQFAANGLLVFPDQYGQIHLLIQTEMQTYKTIRGSDWI